MYMDLTEKFLIASQCSNKYIVVEVKLDGNYIGAEPFKSRTA